MQTLLPTCALQSTLFIYFLFTQSFVQPIYRFTFFQIGNWPQNWQFCIFDLDLCLNFGPLCSFESYNQPIFQSKCVLITLLAQCLLNHLWIYSVPHGKLFSNFAVVHFQPGLYFDHAKSYILIDIHFLNYMELLHICHRNMTIFFNFFESHSRFLRYESEPKYVFCHNLTWSVNCPMVWAQHILNYK